MKNINKNINDELSYFNTVIKNMNTDDLRRKIRMQKRIEITTRPTSNPNLEISQIF